MATTKHIYVYFDNEHCPAPRLMGKLTAEGVRGREVFSFVYHNGQTEADRLGIPRHKQKYMRPAFRV